MRNEVADLKSYLQEVQLNQRLLPQSSTEMPESIMRAHSLHHNISNIFRGEPTDLASEVLNLKNQAEGFRRELELAQKANRQLVSECALLKENPQRHRPSHACAHSASFAEGLPAITMQKSSRSNPFFRSANVSPRDSVQANLASGVQASSR